MLQQQSRVISKSLNIAHSSVNQPPSPAYKLTRAPKFFTIIDAPTWDFPLFLQGRIYTSGAGEYDVARRASERAGGGYGPAEACARACALQSWRRQWGRQACTPPLRPRYNLRPAHMLLTSCSACRVTAPGPAPGPACLPFLPPPGLPYPTLSSLLLVDVFIRSQWSYGLPFPTSLRELGTQER